MTADDMLAELASLGTEQTRKTYRRHGAGENVFGVLTADLTRLRKRIKTDHALAKALWTSGNYDARVLATMIADPEQMDEATADGWARDIDSYSLTGYVAGVVGQTPFARKKMETWTRADDEWIERTGWQLLGHLAMTDPALPDHFFEDYLAAIEQGIHGAKNRVKDAMNGALIGIGARGGALTEKALAAADRIGMIAVDHGDTACKTPDAAQYIRKTLAHRQRK